MDRFRVFFLSGALVITSAAQAQVLIGLDQGNSFMQGLGSNASGSLSAMHRSSIGLVVLDGAPGRTGFRTTLSYGTCSYHLNAANGLNDRWERLSARSDQLRLSAEIRWALSKQYRIYFEFGPVIGAEIRETRSGLSYYRDQPPAFADTLHFTDEVEHGLGIRDVRIRVGVSADVHLAGNWFLLLSAHLSPGFTDWAREHAYGTWEEQLTAGIAYAFGADAATRRPKAEDRGDRQQQDGER